MLVNWRRAGESGGSQPVETEDPVANFSAIEAATKHMTTA